MAKERLSQLQKLILLTADEERRESKRENVGYRWLVLKIARRCSLVHERSGWMLPRYLASISRSIRNLEKKGIISLTYKRDWEWRGRKSRVIRFFRLTDKGRDIVEKIRAATDWEDIPWVEQNRERGRIRLQEIFKFERQMHKNGVNLQ